ncbi:TetR/AcrR family transcriptional regulator [Robiginitalea marina]|uniref:TetR/AcrR family transcriptional regulator n=1 Tax=Robiginitalea marina TaxID=2954105 RepID=A0ABT1AYF8_9FLAO|nr:TetR/AcrR family transcriptional regulator [Robiginitalea marina]MCO5724243.1 TetR/AcrR family transcriptional regulator [Robiginitalea marina]
MEKSLKRMATLHRIQMKGLELFYSKGYDHTSLDDILKALDLSKGAFYYHFQSKEDLMISIAENVLFRKVYSMLIEPLEGQSDPFLAIERCLGDALETAENNELDFGCVLGNFRNQFVGRNAAITKRLDDIYKVWEVNLVSLLQKGKSDGYLPRHLDSEGIATFVMSSYFGVRSLMASGNGRMLRYQYMQQLHAYFRAMVASPVG